jgi:DNA-binding transcriptional ArsR family regulator
VSPPAISQHLKVLREAKLVRMEKKAQQVTLLWNQRFDSLAKFLEAGQKKAGSDQTKKDRQHAESNDQ